jgi:hypothetical protein
MVLHQAIHSSPLMVKQILQLVGRASPTLLIVSYKTQVSFRGPIEFHPKWLLYFIQNVLNKLFYCWEWGCWRISFQFYIPKGKWNRWWVTWLGFRAKVCL